MSAGMTAAAGVMKLGSPNCSINAKTAYGVQATKKAVPRPKNTIWLEGKIAFDFESIITCNHQNNHEINSSFCSLNLTTEFRVTFCFPHRNGNLRVTINYHDHGHYESEDEQENDVWCRVGCLSFPVHWATDKNG